MHYSLPSICFVIQSKRTLSWVRKTSSGRIRQKQKNSRFFHFFKEVVCSVCRHTLFSEGIRQKVIISLISRILELLSLAITSRTSQTKIHYSYEQISFISRERKIPHPHTNINFIWGVKSNSKDLPNPESSKET